MTLHLYIFTSFVRLQMPGFFGKYEDCRTTGPDDPRITEAINCCRAAGHTIHVHTAPPA